jgi:hypothetical protein
VPPFIKGPIRLRRKGEVGCKQLSPLPRKLAKARPARQKAGLNENHLLRNTDNPNAVILFFDDIYFLI